MGICKLVGVSGLSNSGKDTAAGFLIADFKFVGMAFADELKRITQRVYGFTNEQLWGPSKMRNVPDTRYPREHTWKMVKNEKGIETYWECACCGSRSAWLAGHQASQCYLTVRYAIQQIGTTWGRDCYLDTWVDFILRDASKLLFDRSIPSGWLYRPNLGLVSNLSDKRTPEYIGGVIITDVRYLNEMQAIQKAGGKVLRVTRPEAGLAGAAGQHTSETDQQAIPDTAFDAVVRNDSTLEHLQSEMHQFAVLELGL